MANLVETHLPSCLRLARYFLEGQIGANEAGIAQLAETFLRVGEEHAARLVRRPSNRYRVEFDHGGERSQRTWYSWARYQIGDHVDVEIKIAGGWYLKACTVVEAPGDNA